MILDGDFSPAIPECLIELVSYLYIYIFWASIYMPIVVVFSFLIPLLFNHLCVCLSDRRSIFFICFAHF